MDQDQKSVTGGFVQSPSEVNQLDDPQTSDASSGADQNAAQLDSCFMQRAELLLKLERAEFELVVAEHQRNRARLLSKVSHDNVSEVSLSSKSDSTIDEQQLMKRCELALNELSLCDKKLENLLLTQRPDLFQRGDTSTKGYTNAQSISPMNENARLSPENLQTPDVMRVLESPSESSAVQGSMESGLEASSNESSPPASGRADIPTVRVMSSKLERFIATKTQAAGIQLKLCGNLSGLSTDSVNKEHIEQDNDVFASSNAFAFISPDAGSPTLKLSEDSNFNNDAFPNSAPLVSIKDASRWIERDRSQQKRKRAQIARRRPGESLLEEAGHAWATSMLHPPLPHEIWNELWRSLPVIPCLKGFPTESEMIPAVYLARQLVFLRLKRRLQRRRADSSKVTTTPHHSGDSPSQDEPMQRFVKEANDMVKIEESLLSTCDGCCDLCSYALIKSEMLLGKGQHCSTPNVDGRLGSDKLFSSENEAHSSISIKTPHSHSHLLAAQSSFDPLLLADSASALADSSVGTVERWMMFSYLFDTPAPTSDELPNEVVSALITGNASEDSSESEIATRNDGGRMSKEDKESDDLIKHIIRRRLDKIDPDLTYDGLMMEFPTGDQGLAEDYRHDTKVLAAFRAQTVMDVGLSPGAHPTTVEEAEPLSTLQSKIEAVVASRPPMVLSANDTLGDQNESIAPAFIFDLDASGPTSMFFERAHTEIPQRSFSAVSSLCHSQLPFAIPSQYDLEAQSKHFLPTQMYDAEARLRNCIQYCLQEVSMKLATALFGFSVHQTILNDALGAGPAQSLDRQSKFHDSPLPTKRPYSSSALCWHEHLYLSSRSEMDTSCHSAFMGAAPDLSTMSPAHYSVLGEFDDTVITSIMNNSTGSTSKIGEAAQRLTKAAGMYDVLRALPDLFDVCDDTSGEDFPQLWYELRKQLSDGILHDVRAIRHCLATWGPSAKWLQSIESILNLCSQDQDEIGETMPYAKSPQLSFTPIPQIQMSIVSRDHLFVLSSKLLILGLAPSLPSGSLYSLYVPSLTHLPQLKVSERKDQTGVKTQRKVLAGFAANSLIFERFGSSLTHHPCLHELVYGRQSSRQRYLEPFTESDISSDHRLICDAQNLIDLYRKCSLENESPDRVFGNWLKMIDEWCFLKKKTMSSNPKVKPDSWELGSIIPIGPLPKVPEAWKYVAEIDSKKSTLWDYTEFEADFDSEIDDYMVEQKFQKWTLARLLRAKQILAHFTEQVGRSKRVYVLTGPFSELAEIVRREAESGCCNTALPDYVNRAYTRFLFPDSLPLKASSDSLLCDWELLTRSIISGSVGSAPKISSTFKTEQCEPNEWEDTDHTGILLPLQVENCDGDKRNDSSISRRVEIYDKQHSSHTADKEHVKVTDGLNWHVGIAPCTPTHWGEFIELILLELERQ